MTYRHFKHEGWLYLLAFLLALGLRLIQLGAMPFTDAEAAPALQALHIAQGLKPTLSPHPFYILSTAILFFLYGGGTDFLARLLPALVGSSLVFAPLLFDRIKPRPSLILAFFIALDPGLTSLSRQAASSIFAVTFLIFAWGFFSKNKPTLAGFFAALALLSGASIWAGLLSLGITWAILQGLLQLRRSPQTTTDLETVAVDPNTTDYQQPAFNYRLSLISFVVTFIIAGTLFFIAPNGVSAALASIPAFINTWLIPSDVPPGRLVISLLFYQPLMLLLALLAIIHGWRKSNRLLISLSVWFFVSLLLAIFSPSRQVSYLIWAILPLCALAALELVRNVEIFPEERYEVGGVIFLTVFIGAFAWLDFSGMVWLPQESREYVMRFWLLIGLFFLLIMSLLLVAAGWSVRVARLGGVWGFALVLGIFGLAGTLGSTGLRGPDYPELWWAPSVPMQADLLEAAISDLSEWGLGNDDAAPVLISGMESPSLEWTLRDHKVLTMKSLDVSSSPYFVITSFQTDPALVSAYRGQDFTWQQNPTWNEALPRDWIRWVSLREMPQNSETIILWARDDLFLDSASEVTP